MTDPYTSEGLAALPKIADGLSELGETFYHQDCNDGECVVCIVLPAARAVEKAHAEIVRLQGEVRDYHAVRVGGCNHGPGLGAAFHGCEEGLEGK